LSCNRETERPITALVVDNDAIVHAFARSTLTNHGFVVAVAESGEEALEAYAAISPDVVLLDANLPGINGYEVSRKLHQLHGARTVPVLIFTGPNDRRALLRGYQAGATDCFQKPVESHVVILRSRIAVQAHRDKLDLEQRTSILRRAQRVVRMGHWEYDTESGHVEFSEEAKQIFGLLPEGSAASPETDRACVFPADQGRVFRALRESLDRHKRVSIEHRILLPDGEVRHVRQTAEPLDGTDPNGRFWIGTIQDITDQAKMLEKVRSLANYDLLTGLFNRSLFECHLSTSMERARIHAKHVGVLLLDIDRFKRINDRLGHDAGNRLLQTIVHRIQDVVRSSDRLGRTDPTEKQSTMGRSGGDEFMLLFPNMHRPEDATLVANRILAVLQDPFEINGKKVTVTGSIGVAIYPLDGLDVETLIRNAETSMYCAKGSGGNGIQYFGDTKTTALIKKIAMEEQLRSALERKEFELHYQPKIELATGMVVGFEGLLRWKNPELGLVSPAEFIPIAEETSLIQPIGRWVIEEACRTIKNWQRAGLRPVPIAVNVSTHQFGSEDLYELVSGTLARHELEPRWLEIEITESAIMQDCEGSAATLRRLQEDGLRISLDDFGTGYSSLWCLKRFPLDTLKIDRSFAIDLPHDHDAAGIVQAIIAMANALGLTVIAEGVETEDQRSFLTSIGCNQMQGFLVSPALPAEEVVRFLEPGFSVFKPAIQSANSGDLPESERETGAGGT